MAWKGVEQHLLGNHESEYCRRRECSQPGYIQKFTATDGRDQGIIRNFIDIYGSDSVCTKYCPCKTTNVVESAHELTAVMFSKNRYSSTGVDLDAAAFCCGLMVNNRGVWAAALVLKELGVSVSQQQAQGLAGWEYERMQSHLRRSGSSTATPSRKARPGRQGEQEREGLQQETRADAARAGGRAA